jgi:hypothetical protein
VKGRNDSVKENVTAGYYVSLLESLKPQNQIKTSDCDSPHDMASGEYNSLSSTEIPKRQTTVSRELKSSEESSQFSSLAQLADRHSKKLEPKSSEDSNQFSSLAQLAGRHSKKLEPKSSEESNQFSSLAQLADRHLKILESKSSDNRSQFSSLAQLGKRHLKILKPESSKECSHFSSLVQFANKRSLETDHQSSEGHSSSSFAQLADRYGKVTQLCVRHGDTNLSTLKLADTHSGPQTKLTSQHQRVCKDFSSHHLEAAENKATNSGRRVMETERAQRTGQISCSQTGYVGSKTSSLFPSTGSTEQEAISPAVWKTTRTQASDAESDLFSVPHRTGEPVRDYGATSDSGSSAGVEPSPVVRTLSEEETEMDLEIDFTNALISPGSRTSQKSVNFKPEITCWELDDVEEGVPSDTAMFDTSQFTLDLNFTSSILNQKLPSHKRKSPFGRTLCRKWKRLPTPYIPPQKQGLGTVVCFAFDTISPDDRILEARPPYI